MLSQSPYIPQVFRLNSISAYSNWGAFLTGIRKHNDLTQKQIATASESYFIKAGMPILKERIYGEMERGKRPPAFKELEPLFRTYVEVFGVEFSDLEITAYVHLAKEKIAQKKKRRERVDDAQWEDLIERLFRINQTRRTQRIHLIRVEPASARSTRIEDPESRRLKAVEQALRIDTAHLLEREEWVEKMVSYPERSPQAKLVVVQGHMGTGKSHALALLIQRLAKKVEYYLIPYLFEAGSGKTPEDHLEVYLATIVADLTMTAINDEMKQRPLEERIDQVLTLLKERSELGQKVILLLDDAQVIFPTALEWPPAWLQFFEALVREPHSTTLYMMTRTWPGWDDRRLAYIEELDLPPLSAEAAVAVWRRKGFDDVPEDLLRKISYRYGYNPQLIEMSIAQCKKRSFTYAWMKDGAVTSRTHKNPNTEQLESLLAQDTIFDPTMDVKARAMLQQSLTSRLSHQAVQIMECLSLSPLGLPFSLLVEEFARAKEAFFDELVGASAVDLNAAASQRAALVPLVREAQYQALLSEGRRESIDQRVTDLYSYWLSTLQDFRDDSEKAGLIAEMVVRYIRQRQLLKAAELFISFGWLCTLFGHITRIQRVFDEMVKEDRGKDEDAKHEVGRLLLQHHIGIKMGKKITTAERNQIYQHIHRRVLADEVALEGHAEIDLLHHLLIMFLGKSLFTEAGQVLDETFARLQRNRQLTAEIQASYLNNKARWFARQWEKAENEGNLELVQRFQRECVATLKESIAQWRHCLRNALPLQTHYVNFKLARTLNDYAYRQRLCGNLDEARDAIEECLYLKKAGGVLPHSLAISLSEFSQILALQGSIKKALACNDEAITIVERLLEEGNTSHGPELGVFLIERADILRLQVRLEEAKALLHRAIPLIGEKPSRQHFRLKAERGIEEISFMLETGQRYQLDKRWFPRYLELASYDSLAWLAYAGPFTQEEEQEWKRLLPRREEEEVAARMTSLIVQSRQRELARSQKEQQSPKLWYPLIPLEEVQHRIRQFGLLGKEIERQETNAIVRALYVDAINEQVLALRQCEATALGDQQTVWQCNLSMYGKPNTREMYIALQSLCEMVLEAQDHERAGAVAQDVLRQLKDWGLSPHDIAAMKFFSSQQEPVPSFKQRMADGGKKFSHTIVQQFFRDIFAQEYHAPDWNVEIALARDGVYIDVDLKTLFLPPKPFTLHKIRELLAEEVEIHAYRSLSGLRSPLALLGSGLARYNVTEEGLANHYIQQVALHVYGEEKSKTWIGTLATGLAAGVLTPALSFYELATFLEKTFLISKLLSSKMVFDEAITVARQQAWSRAARTFRGIPCLEDAGCCSLKDVIYLRGYLLVKPVLEQIEEQRLFVGKMGVEHLNALEELHIVAPSYPHRQLALAPDLLDRLSLYKP